MLQFLSMNRESISGDENHFGNMAAGSQQSLQLLQVIIAEYTLN